MLHLRHRLGATGHDDARRPGRDHAGGVQDGLEAGAAAAVHLDAGHSGAETRIEGGGSADRGCLAARIALPEHDVVDVALAEAGAPHQLGERL